MRGDNLGRKGEKIVLIVRGVQVHGRCSAVSHIEPTAFGFKRCSVEGWLLRHDGVACAIGLGTAIGGKVVTQVFCKANSSIAM
jgi:hypothetical protein